VHAANLTDVHGTSAGGAALELVTLNAEFFLKQQFRVANCAD
jgi:hypothetical protein